MDLRLKKEFRGETGFDVFVWDENNEAAYTEAYVEWLETKINIKHGNKLKEKDKQIEELKEITEVCCVKAQKECLKLKKENKKLKERVKELEENQKC